MMTRNVRSRRPLLFAACLTAAALVAATARGQEEDGSGGAMIEAPKPDDNIGVFVRDSAVAADKLALAQRMEKSQEWDKSAELYQEVLDGFADRVVPTHFDALGRADRYGGVTNVVQDRIAAWPDAGREVYITRYGTPAAKLFADADPGDRAALTRIADRYFVTDAGRDAALRLIEIHFNAGEFAACASLADRLLDHHPSLSETDRPLLLLRSTLAWRLAGEPGRAAPRADALTTKYGDARATLGGQDRSLGEVARAELAKPTDAAGNAAAHAQANAWRMPFGSADHASVAAEPEAPARGQPAREWGKLLSFDLEQGATTPGDDDEIASLRALIKRQRDLGASTGILPSIDGTQLFFQDNVRIYARDLATGAPLPGWLASYPGDRGAYKIDANFTPRGAQMTVTLTDGNVLAIVGQDDGLNLAMFGGEQPQMPGGAARLVCLDRVTGKPVWTRTMSDVATAQAAVNAAMKKNIPKTGEAGDTPKLPPPIVAEPQVAPGRRVRVRNVPNVVPGVNAPALAGDESLRQTQPRGSVLVVGDSVYIVARGGEQGAFEDCYLVSFTLATGEFRWARHLASGNASRMAFNGFPQPSNGADSHLACVDGRIFVSTDMGAVAAVDAVDGSLAWLSLYPRPRLPQQGQQWMQPDGGTRAKVKPAFEGNPVIVRDGKVITLPGDGENIFVHDAVTGEEIARLPTQWRLDENFNVVGSAEGGAMKPQAKPGAVTLGASVQSSKVLVGLDGDALVLSGPTSLSIVDFTKLVAPRADGRTDRAPADVVRHNLAMRAPGFEDVAIRGRPFVTDRSVYVPTGWALFRYDLASDKVLERYPANDDWQNRVDESPGNVVVANGNVIVAGPERVSVYAGLDLVKQRLDAGISAAPDAVAPRLRYAEAMANAGHNDEALKFVNEAASKVAADKPPEDADRAAVFATCTTLVRDLNRPGRRADATFQSALLAHLTTIAATPNQQVTTRLLRGGLAAQAKDYPTAIEAYQSLIENASWGSIRAKVSGDVTPVASIAADALKVLLATDDGRAAYAAVEARAAAALDKAKASNDPLAIFAVADHYPNSRAAGEAVRASSELLTSDSATAAARPQLPLAVLRKLAGGITTPAARASIDDAMLRTYLAAGDLPAALGRARRLAWADASYALNDLPAKGGSISATTASAVVEQLQQAVFDQQEARLPDLNANLDGDSFDAAHPIVVADISSLLPPTPLAGGRADRIVTIAKKDNRALKIFEPGGVKALKTIPVPNVTDKTLVTWLPDDRLLLRQSSRVACVDVNGEKLAWTFDPAALPEGDVGGASGQVASLIIDDAGLVALAPRPAVATVSTASPEDQQFEQLVQQGNMDPVVADRLIRNRRLARQNAVMQGRNVQIQVANGANGELAADPRPDDNNKESATDALPVANGTLVAIATSHGRVVVVDAVTGATRWRLKLGDRAPGAFKVVGDIVVYATTDESTSRVIAIDATTGDEVLRQTIPGGPAARICNVGVSDEGWLTLVTPLGLQLFDLLGGGRDPLANIVVNSDTGNPTFAQSRTPDAVQFCGDKLLVLGDVLPQGLNIMPSVRSYDLPDLKVTHVVGAKSKQSVERRFVPKFAKDQRTGTEPIEISVHKDRLYISTGLLMTSYPVLDEDPADSAWSRVLPDRPSTLSLQSPLMVKEGVLLVGWPSDFLGQNAPAAKLELYSRQTYDGKHESGMCVDDPDLTKRGGKIVDQFQPVNGGVYYTTTDGSLVFVPGKPKPAEAK